MLLQKRVRRSLAEVHETVEVKAEIRRSSSTIARIIEELEALYSHMA